MKKILITVYVVMVVVTFGHAWNRDYDEHPDRHMAASTVAPVSAALWPLYWSTVAWDHKGKK